ncbi:MAG: hypothetical protein MUF15_12890, partial [Acidobacteria bacterium]|nr:hypothetical protein [Acidobacteriota bacterium]
MLKYKILSVFLCLCALASIIFGANEFPLPPDNFVRGWQKKGQVQKFDRNGLYGHINGGSELFLEFGFENLRLQKYQCDGDEISIEVYSMDIPEAALAIYLARCGKETPVPGISVRNTGDYRQIIFLHQNYFSVVDNFSGKANVLPVMVQLAEETLKCLPIGKEKKDEFSHLFSLLPVENKVVGSELLVRGYYSLQSIYTFGEGDILLLKNKIFGIAAEYKDKKRDDLKETLEAR